MEITIKSSYRSGIRGMLMTFRVVVSLLVISFISGWWHPYDFHKHYPAECNRSVNATRIDYDKSLPTPDQIAKWRLWPGLISSYDRKYGESASHFVHGIEAVYNHQHPPDCSKVKFLVAGGYEEGFGAETHVLGAGLGLAMNLNRVYLMNNPHGINQVKLDNRYGYEINTSYCRNQQNKLSLECYFESWSSCNLSHALNGEDYQDDLYRTTEIDPEDAGSHMRYNPQDPHYNYLEEKYVSQRTLRVRLTSYEAGREFIPHTLLPYIRCSPMHDSKQVYWWRAISAAYLLRPNAGTVGLLDKYRQQIILGGAGHDSKSNSVSSSCVSVYIRRGDKHNEMKIEHDVSIFLDTAAILYNHIQHDHHDHISDKKKTIFLGSEDPEVIDYAIHWASAAHHDWRLLYSNLFDRRSVSTFLSYQEQAKLWDEHRSQHSEQEYLSMLVNLDMHLRCSAFVCTMASNFCRVIDELRATVGGKANAHLAEIECKNNPPCIDRDIPLGW